MPEPWLNGVGGLVKVGRRVTVTRGAGATVLPMARVVASTFVPGERRERRMPTASSLRWALAAVMIATAMYHAGRLVVARLRHPRSELDVDLTHAAMGVATTIILVGSVCPDPCRRVHVLFSLPLLRFLSARLLYSLLARPPPPRRRAALRWS